MLFVKKKLLTEYYIQNTSLKIPWLIKSYIYLINFNWTLLFQDGEKCSLEKVVNLEYQNIPCIQAVFSNDNKTLVTAPNTGGLFIYQLQSPSASLESKIETKGKILIFYNNV